jgi:hypothetical protein
LEEDEPVDPLEDEPLLDDLVLAPEEPDDRELEPVDAPEERELEPVEPDDLVLAPEERVDDPVDRPVELERVEEPEERPVELERVELLVAEDPTRERVELEPVALDVVEPDDLEPIPDLLEVDRVEEPERAADVLDVLRPELIVVLVLVSEDVELPITERVVRVGRPALEADAPLPVLITVRPPRSV